MVKHLKVDIFPISKENIPSYLTERGIKTNDFFIQYLGHAKYESVFNTSQVEVIITNLEEMGFTKPVTHDEIKTKALDLGYKVAPPHLAFYLRLAMLDQPPSANIILSKQAFPDSAIQVFVDKIEPDDDFPRSVYLRNVDGALWLRAARYTDDYLFSLNSSFAFVL